MHRREVQEGQNGYSLQTRILSRFDSLEESVDLEYRRIDVVPQERIRIIAIELRIQIPGMDLLKFTHSSKAQIVYGGIQ